MEGDRVRFGGARLVRRVTCTPSYMISYSDVGYRFFPSSLFRRSRRSGSVCSSMVGTGEMEHIMDGNQQIADGAQVAATTGRKGRLRALTKELASVKKELEEWKSKASRGRRGRDDSPSSGGEDEVAELGPRGRLPKGVPQDVAHAIRFDRPLMYSNGSKLGMWSKALLHFVKHPESRLRGTGKEQLLRRFAVITQHPILREGWELLSAALEEMSEPGPLPVAVRSVVAELTALFITCSKLDVVSDAENRIDHTVNMLVTPLSTLLTLSSEDVKKLKPASTVTATLKANVHQPVRQEQHSHHTRQATGVLQAPQYQSPQRIRADRDECFNCGGQGHIRQGCPQPAMPQPWFSRRMPGGPNWTGN